MTPKERGTVITVVGPTATGKTALAVELCQQLRGEIIGADSIQVYRGCDIGAAKPRPEELQGVRHHLLDVADPDEAIDAARFAALADTAIAEVRKRGRVPIVVGGTGLWLRALLQGLVPAPPVDPALRARLQEEWTVLGPLAMHERLNAIDPRAASAIHPNDQVRVIRALEVHAQTGKALGDLRRAHALGMPRYQIFGLYIDLPRPVHQQRIAERTRTMIARGFADEVLNLVKRHGPRIRPLSAVGYRQMLRHLCGPAPLSVVAQDIARATRKYAARQRTWFNHDATITLRTDPQGARNPEVRSQIQRLLNSHS